MAVKVKPQGGVFLIEDAQPDDIVTPEDLNEEQRMMQRTFRDFGERDVAEAAEEIEKQNSEVILQLFQKAAELGMFMIEVSEEDGGLGLDFVSTLAVIQETGAYGSISTTLQAHQSIGMFPTVSCGTPEQFQKYIPGLMDGSTMAAYALTEPGSGSDALSAKLTAKLSEDGKHYILNGTKQFISNAKWAGLFTVFGKIDGDKFTAFLVERDTPGFEIGPEEDKLGIKGSSTTSLKFNDVKIPVENLLGEIGQGHKIALNCLNLGRFKLAGSVACAAKHALKAAAQYGAERTQFGHPLTDFGLIKHKLGEMAARIYAAESACYRIAGLIQNSLDSRKGGDTTCYQQKFKALYEFSAECAFSKVYCSEVLDYVVDETLQIFGGYGFIEEYPVARMYRDARIARLYEGTSEICRLHGIGTIFKSEGKGELGLMAKVLRLRPNDAPDSSAGDADDLEAVRARCCETKKVFLHLSGLILQRFPSPEALMEQQELLGHLADIACELLASESAVLRAMKTQSRHGEEDAKHLEQMARIYADIAAGRIGNSARTALAALFSGDALREQFVMVNSWLPLPVDTITLRRAIADTLVANKGELPELQN